ncbi:dihydrofolate reductase [Bacillus cereus]
MHATFEGDRYFPEIAFSLWKEIYTEKGIQNDKNPYVNLPNHLVLFIH